MIKHPATALVVSLAAGIAGCQTGTEMDTAPPVREQPPIAVKPLEEQQPVTRQTPTRGHSASGVTVMTPPEPAAPGELPTPPRATVAMPDIADAPIYDRNAPAYGLLQQANTALAGFPLDAEGNVDWVRALRGGHITPRVSISGHGQMEISMQEIVMRNTREMPAVVFPHQAHSEWLACENCHDGIFIAKQGANTITMDDIFRGRYCGVCHDKVAFSTYVCDRCHSVPAVTDK